MQEVTNGMREKEINNMNRQERMERKNKTSRLERSENIDTLYINNNNNNNYFLKLNLWLTAPTGATPVN